MKDEERQIQIEKGNVANHDADSAAYRKVFDALRKEPSYQLSPPFVSKIVQQVLLKKQQKELRKDYVWLGLGIFSFAIAFIVTFALTDFTLTSGVFKFISSYGGLMVFGVAFIFVLHWLDKRLLHPRNTF
jgi:hypothetical protein